MPSNGTTNRNARQKDCPGVSGASEMARKLEQSRASAQVTIAAPRIAQGNVGNAMNTTLRIGERNIMLAVTRTAGIARHDPRIGAGGMRRSRRQASHAATIPPADPIAAKTLP